MEVKEELTVPEFDIEIWTLTSHIVYTGVGKYPSRSY